MFPSPPEKARSENLEFFLPGDEGRIARRDRSTFPPMFHISSRPAIDFLFGIYFAESNKAS